VQGARDHFTAGFAGAKIQLSGTVTNASAVREWEFFSTQQPVPAEALQNRLRQLADTLERIHFSAPPFLKLDLRGDARDLQSFTIRLGVSAPGAETPWGVFSQGRFTARLLPASANGPSRAELTLSAGGARADWAATTNLLLSVYLVSVQKQTNLVKGEMVLTAGTVETRWGSASNALFSANWIHALTNPVPLSGEGHLRCEAADTKLADGASARRLEVNARLAAAELPLRGDESWAWWTNLAPYILDWDFQVAELHSPKVLAECATAGGRWHAPELTITNFHAELYDAQLQVRAGLNVATRALRASVTSNLDPHQLA